MTKHEAISITDLLALPTMNGLQEFRHYTTPATDLDGRLSEINDTQAYLDDLRSLLESQAKALRPDFDARQPAFHEAMVAVGKAAPLAGVTPQWTAYLVDVAQRWVVFLDTLRRRGNQFVEHEQHGCPPVLAYEYEVVVDGATLPRPINYSLVKIQPPPGVTTIEKRRPYIIIDPRAGHGSGIGGFKSESEVGVALAAGHPTYFCIFTTHPVPGQTIADICRGEAHFVREVQRRHPDSAKPVVIGNCQGGWAAMLLASTNPDLTGPVVVNGSPLSYWSGVRGKAPMRYLGGLMGGVSVALLAADLGNGEFDGAHLVQNFEQLNPSNTYWKKYYELFRKGETEAERYLEFERWWSGFYFMNENEIRWIVETLFVGNKLAFGRANLDSRLHADFRHIRAPVICFASHGDNITPPAQALGWIRDIYSNVREIKARGQRIVYTVHDSIGHLGIFVSSQVAQKQHAEITSTMKTIEALAPGLYEMIIVEAAGEGVNRTYRVEFEERTIEDLDKLGGSRTEERMFATIARVSELNAQVYEFFVRPWVRATVSPRSAKGLIDTHPLRQRRYAFSDRNPLMTTIAPLAQAVHENRRPCDPANPFMEAETAVSEAIIAAWDSVRDLRDAACEFWVTATFNSPWMRTLVPTTPQRISEIPGTDLRAIPTVHNALEDIAVGGYAEAVIRMLILLAHSRTSVRRDRLERSNQVLHDMAPFNSLDHQTRNQIIHRQSLIVDFEPDQALSTLPLLLVTEEDRKRAIEICEFIAGAREEMDAHTIDMFATFRTLLDLPEDEPTAPAKKSTRGRKSGADKNPETNPEAAADVDTEMDADSEANDSAAA